MLSAAEISAIRIYTGVRYVAINGCLRNDLPCSAGTLQLIRLIDSAIAKHPLPRALILYRGVKGQAALDIRAAGVRRGVILADSAFTSCSRVDSEAAFFAQPPPGTIMRISAPAGTPALPVESYSQFLKEREILLPRNMRIRILDYEAATGQVICEIA